MPYISLSFRVIINHIYIYKLSYDLITHICMRAVSILLLKI